MKETMKANERRERTKIFKEKIFKGAGIDIGCGPDILQKSVFTEITSIKPFDRQDGNAQFIDKYETPESYDFVYSSNCLEHMIAPLDALKSWFALVKDGGYLVFTVPDEDLYEQGVFPSKFNLDHKWTFTIFKKKTWSPRSVNVTSLLQGLDNCRILKVELIDTNYDYSKKGVDQTLGKAEAFIEVIIQKNKNLPTN